MRVILIDRVGLHRFGRPVHDHEDIEVFYVGETVANPCQYRFLKGAAVVDLGNDAELRKTLCDVAQSFQPDAVVCTSERQLETAAWLREMLGLAGRGRVETARYRDKFQMKRWAVRADLRTPEFSLELGPSRARQVLKPRCASGSQGIFILEPGQIPPTGLVNYMSESFVEGSMVHIDGYVVAGDIKYACASRYLSDTLSMTRQESLLSVVLCGEEADLFLDYADRVISGFGFTSGVFHLEVFDTPAGPVFCEIAARFGGAGVIETVEAVGGVNLADALFRSELGLDVDRMQPRTRVAGWIVHYAHCSGLVVGVDENFPPEWLVNRVEFAKIGSAVEQSLFSGTGVLAHIVGGTSTAEVTERLMQLRSINVELRSHDE